MMRATPLCTRAKVSAHWGSTGGAGVVGPPVGTAVPPEVVEGGLEGVEGGVEGGDAGVEGGDAGVEGGDATGGGAGVQPTRVTDRTPAASAATGR
ncbi:hypothetical protein [Tersicoccus phoenicis]|uniref:hypothetical protein n=1 Tax=Tersicoccus phoenicis TaxID=554083 RepID=UPI001C44D096|nr:hypothetical protein [Tersicoccus phoenicis]